VLSFGGGFIDYDNDGWLDLFIANGHVYPEIEQASQGTRYKQVNSVFHNDSHSKFVEVSKDTGVADQIPNAARGVAFADFDNDGFIDVLVANNGEAPSLLHNGGNANHFINFKLVGTKSNRDAMGSRVHIVSGGISQIREIAGAGSYLSQSDLRANFGMGKAAVVQTVEVKWPSGQTQTFHNVRGDKFYLITEANDDVRTQRFVGAAQSHK
jgi:hypothetical protein